MNLYKCRLTENILKIFHMSLENPLLRYHAAIYKMDDEFLYFPAQRFLDESVIPKLIIDRVIFEVDDDDRKRIDAL